MSQKNDTLALIISLLLTLGILGGGYWFLKGRTSKNPATNNPNTTTVTSSEQIKQSLGNTQLVLNDNTPQKAAGIQAFSQGNYKQAISNFQASLKIKPNDPESLIYLNNAQAQNHNPLKIAVVVPIGKSESIAKEILRGVAQKQNEINQQGGINGRYLQVLIVNDNNDPQLAQQVASQLGKDKSILAVMGHNSSNATIPAAQEYEKSGLVMISPTSNANEIATLGNYIFRTIPSVKFEATALSRYVVNQGKKTKILVCFDSQTKYSVSFKEDFTNSILTDGGQVINVNCDFADPNFNPLTIFSQAKQQGADSILLVPSVDKIPSAIAMIQANQKQLSLFGASALYTFETLEKGQNLADGMVLTVPWYPDAFLNHPFSKNAVKLWGGEVNWRSALSYDAAHSLGIAFKQNTTRQGIQQTLSDPNFNTQGASGEIRFLPSGDRQSAPIFVKIVSQPKAKNPSGFGFIHVK